MNMCLRLLLAWPILLLLRALEATLPLLLPEYFGTRRRSVQCVTQGADDDESFELGNKLDKFIQDYNNNLARLEEKETENNALKDQVLDLEDDLDEATWKNGKLEKRIEVLEETIYRLEGEVDSKKNKNKRRLSLSMTNLRLFGGKKSVQAQGGNEGGSGLKGFASMLDEHQGYLEGRQESAGGSSTLTPEFSMDSNFSGATTSSPLSLRRHALINRS